MSIPCTRTRTRASLLSSGEHATKWFVMTDEWGVGGNLSKESGQGRAGQSRAGMLLLVGAGNQ